MFKKLPVGCKCDQTILRIGCFTFSNSSYQNGVCIFDIVHKRTWFARMYKLSLSRTWSVEDLVSFISTYFPSLFGEQLVTSSMDGCTTCNQRLVVHPIKLSIPAFKFVRKPQENSFHIVSLCIFMWTFAYVSIHIPIIRVVSSINKINWLPICFTFSNSSCQNGVFVVDIVHIRTWFARMDQIFKL
jgi:hypothetical protein